MILNSPPGGRCCHKCAVLSVACAFSVQIFKDFYSAANQNKKTEKKKQKKLNKIDKLINVICIRVEHAGYVQEISVFIV